MENNKELPKSFNRLIQDSEKPVLVNFFATWSNPCKVVSPLINKIAKEYSGKIISVRINIDKHRYVSTKYYVQDIPTIMLFFKGKELMRITGGQSYEYYKEQIEKVIREN